MEAVRREEGLAVGDKPDWDAINQAIKDYNATGAPGTLAEFESRYEAWKKLIGLQLTNKSKKRKKR